MKQTFFKISTLLLILAKLLLVGCENGNENPFGGLPQSQQQGTGQPQCPVLIASNHVTDASAQLALTVDGQDVPLSFDASMSFKPSALYGAAIHALCLSASRRNATTEGPLHWTQLGLIAQFHDGAGNPRLLMMLSDFLNYKNGVGAPILQVLLPGKATPSVLFVKSGEIRVVEPPMVCGGETTLEFVNLAGRVDTPLDNGTPFSLSGSFSFRVPAAVDNPLAKETVSPVFLCDGKTTRGEQITSDRPDLLPFNGSCWDGGNFVRGSNLITFGLRARAASKPVGALEQVPWVMNLTFLAPLAEGDVLQVHLPKHLVSLSDDDAVKPGSLYVDIENHFDGIGGADWRAVSGTLTITKYVETAKSGSMFTSLQMEGDLDIRVQYLGDCTQRPELQGDTVRITGKVILVKD